MKTTEDSVLMEQVISFALDSSGVRSLRNVPMLSLLNAYDQVVKNNRTKVIDPNMATRVYRKLLKMHREEQERIETQMSMPN